MTGNRAVVYQGPGQVEVRDGDYPTYEMKDGPGVNKANVGRRTPHGAILKTVATNICGSDQHMVRGRTTAPVGLILGHEITGEVVEKGLDVENLAVGDLVSVPFNVSCGRCRSCRESNTGVCLNVNPERPGGAYGYVDMGGWPGGQAEYVMVPYADWTALRFPDRDQAMDKIRDLTMLTDIFPTGYHGCVTAGVGTGSTVYIAGAGPVGLAAVTASGTSMPSGSRMPAASAARPLTPRPGRCPTRSTRSSGCLRLTQRWTVSASKPRVTPRTGSRRLRRPCSTLRWRSPAPAGGSASPGCT